VTVYLRVVSVRTGEVLKVVYTSKKILSQSVDAGLFQYVSFKRLLEVETGFTYNEPGELAVREAIEKAVQSLILEGIIDGLWTTLDANDKDGEAVKAYKEEKKGLAQIDVLGKEVKDRRSKLALQFGSTSTLYNGDYPNASLRSGLEIGVQYNFKPSLGLAFHYAGSSMTAGTFYDEKINYGELVGEYRLLPYDAFTPYIVGGLGFITESESFLNFNKIFPKANVGGGLEYMFNQKVGFRLAIDYNYILSDELDDIKQGKYNDAYWRGNVGVSIYFGNTLTGERKFK
jgi:curli production assembly/transport component CsgG